MDSIDNFFLAALVAMPVALVGIVILPPVLFLMRTAASWIDETVAAYFFGWRSRAADRAERDARRRSQEEFSEWVSSRIGGAAGDAVDEELVEAQKLMTAIRLLVEEEIPAAVRRCNGIHRKMALLSGAAHMREIAAEPECLLMREWTGALLVHTEELIWEYPVRLRLESDDLIHASIVLRKSLIPTCTRCPYIRQTVVAAGEVCPAAQLIQIAPEERNA